MRDAPDGVVSQVFTDLIAQFDARPLTAHCDACRGSGAVVLAPPVQTALVCLCRDCAASAQDIAMADVGSFAAAIAHVESGVRNRRRESVRRIVRNLARLKGAPHRLTETAAKDFFRACLVKQTVEATVPDQ